MVQIAGLQELQVDSVELLLEVINSSFFITPPQQYKYRGPIHFATKQVQWTYI